MIKIKVLAKILKQDDKLYKTCGLLFDYLGQVRANFSNLKVFSTSPWELSQIVDLYAASRLDHFNLSIIDIIANFCGYFKKGESRNIIKNSFNAMVLMKEEGFYDKNKKLELLDLVALLSTWNIKQTDLQAIVGNIEKENLNALLALLNGTFSNNPLYFFPLYLLLLEILLTKNKYANCIKSILLNLYLLKNNLVFAPSVCFNYTLLTFNSQYQNWLNKVFKDQKAIINYAHFVFDLLKQAMVVSRALINDLNENKNKMILLKNNEEYKKLLTDKNLLKILTTPAFFINIKDKSDKNQKNLKIINFLMNQNLLSNKKIYENYEVYLFKNYDNSIDKLLKNKHEKTTKLFNLKEYLS